MSLICHIRNEVMGFLMCDHVEKYIIAIRKPVLRKHEIQNNGLTDISGVKFHYFFCLSKISTILFSIFLFCFNTLTLIFILCWILIFKFS